MIIYKREMTLEDIANLDEDEELIYYMADNIAITINKSNNQYIVRKKQISDNELIEEKSGYKNEISGLKKRQNR